MSRDVNAGRILRELTPLNSEAVLEETPGGEIDRGGREFGVENVIAPMTTALKLLVTTPATCLRSR